jgi:hypothetical protein
MGVAPNMDRALLKVRWQAGGECVRFAEELQESVRANKADSVNGIVVVERTDSSGMLRN